MHELSIAMNMLDIAEEQSRHHGGGAVQVIYLQLGPLSGVVAEALESAFELARECSPFPACRLIIEPVPLTVHCPNCQGERSAESIARLCCAECGTPTGLVVHGQEMEITAMEIETPGVEVANGHDRMAGPSSEE